VSYEDAISRKRSSTTCVSSSLRKSGRPSPVRTSSLCQNHACARRQSSTDSNPSPSSREREVDVGERHDADVGRLDDRDAPALGIDDRRAPAGQRLVLVLVLVLVLDEQRCGCGLAAV